MFGIFAPITYNTNLNSFFGGYDTPFYAGYSPLASLFNSQPRYYGGMIMGNPYLNSYQYNYYPNICLFNYTSPVSYGGGYYGGNVVSAAPVVSLSANMAVTNPVQTTSSAKPAKTKNASTTSPESRLRQEIINVARKYSSCAEYNNSHLKFCINPTCKIDDPLNEEWCTDFVTYVVKEAYRNQGKTPPVGFGNHDVKTMKNWAIHNGYFINTTNKARKGDFISKNIKPGDIMIINENNFSHTGIVTKIGSNGVIHTIEGNRDDKVKEYSYSPNYPNLSGFIRLIS